MGAVFKPFNQSYQRTNIGFQGVLAAIASAVVVRFIHDVSGGDS